MLKASLERLSCIWDRAEHNAFTSLTRLDTRLFLAIRESDSHQDGLPGAIRILSSSDGTEWHSEALLKDDSWDLRDPKFLLMTTGELLLTVGAVPVRSERPFQWQTFASTSPDGKKWSKFQPISPTGEWIWSLIQTPDGYFGTGYRFKPYQAALFQGVTPFSLEKKTTLSIPGHPSEAGMARTNDGRLLQVIRRDGDANLNHAWVSTSSFPFEKWSGGALNCHLAAPALLVWKDQTLLCAGRIFDKDEPRTALGTINDQIFTPLIVLPSGGDNSYPSLLYYENFLYLSYYSSHEIGTNIYLAKLRIT